MLRSGDFRGLRISPVLAAMLAGAVAYAIPAHLAWSQAASAPASDRPECGCPTLPVVATNDKPAAGRAFGELSTIDVEAAFSNRVAFYGGDWDKALLALAHEIDPGGTMHIWTDPAPTPVDPNAVLKEGDLSEFLINGPAPGGAPPPPGTPPPGPNARFPVNAVSFSGLTVNIVYTIARITKYGEPEFGLRKKLLRIARFLADDLYGIPFAEAIKGGRAQQVGAASLAARVALLEALRNAVKHDDRDIEGFRKSGAMLWRTPHAVSPPEPKPGEQELAIDDLDLANAALEIILSVDDKKKQGGLLQFFGRPNKFDAAGRPIYGPEDHASDLFFSTFPTSLMQLAARRAAFGGTAAAGSPEDAVGCKALSVLAALGDTARKDGAAVRWGMFNLFFLQFARFRGRDPSFSGFSAPGMTVPTEPLFLVWRSLELVMGVADETEAKRQADWLFQQLGWIAGINPNGAAFRAFGSQSGDRVLVATLRDFSRYSRGHAHRRLMQLLQQHFDEMQQRADTARQATKGGPSKGLENFQSWIDAWNTMQPDWSPVTVAELCRPEYAPPRVVIFAEGAPDPYLLDKLYQNVPMALGVVFPEAYDGASYNVSLRTTGGRLDLVAKPIDDDRTLFKTDRFVIPGQ